MISVSGPAEQNSFAVFQSYLEYFMNMWQYHGIFIGPSKMLSLSYEMHGTIRTS